MDVHEWKLGTGDIVFWNEDGTLRTSLEELDKFLKHAKTEGGLPITTFILKALIVFKQYSGSIKDSDDILSIIHASPEGRVVVKENEAKWAREYYKLFTKREPGKIIYSLVKN